MRVFLLLLISSLLSGFNSNAATFTAVQSGAWNQGSTWGNANPADYPKNSSDLVYIAGFEIIVDAVDITVGYVEINDSNSHTTLIIQNGGTLQTTGDIDLISDSHNKNIELLVLGNLSLLNIGGNLTIDRAVSDNFPKRIEVSITGTSKIKIGTDLILDYQTTASKGRTYFEIYDSSILEVLGNIDINTQGGDEMLFEIETNGKIIAEGDFTVQKHGGKEIKFLFTSAERSTIGGSMTLQHNGGSQHLDFKLNTQGKVDIEGSLNLLSGVPNQVVHVEARDSNSELTVGGDVTMLGITDGDVDMNLQDGAKMYLGGNFQRPSFGSFDMDEHAELILNGTTSQNIPNTNSVGTDEFNITNISFDNSSGNPMILQNTFTVTGTLDLSEGIIVSEASKPLILADNAMISGGSNVAYVEGPVIKQGRSSGNLVIPVGDNNVYAPIALTPISKSTSSYTIEYNNDPPPIGSLGTGVTEVSNYEYWSVNWTADSDTIGMTLNWEDADASGITSLDDLIVVYQQGAGSWTNMGNTATTGGVGLSVSGSVTNDGLNDPPPIGSLSITFGKTISGPGSLPVELIRFGIKEKSEESVLLEWETATEINFNHFEIERSTDGVSFDIIGTVHSSLNNLEGATYAFLDDAPFYGKNYYRLKQLDLDGTFEYSEIRMVNFYISNQLSIFPNPVVNQINIQGIYRELRSGTVEIYNQAGHLVYQRNHTFESGMFHLPIEEAKINEPGIYYIIVIDKQGTRSTTFIKV